MLQSKFNRAAIFNLFLILFLFVYCSIGICYSIVKLKEFTFLNLIWICLIILFLLRKIIYDPINIKIDVNTKIISFKNILINQSKTFLSSAFDGYIIVIIQGRAKRFKMLYLIKNKKAIKKVKIFYYTNGEQIQEGINNINIKCLGSQKQTALLQYNVLFNKPIL